MEQRCESRSEESSTDSPPASTEDNLAEKEEAPLRALVFRAGTITELGSITDQVFALEDAAGTQHYWNASAGRRLASRKAEVLSVSLRQMEVTLEQLRERCPDLDEAYAQSTDIRVPLLFVPLGGTVQLIDGCHRMCKALSTGIDVLPACLLTQEEADSILRLTLPPDQALDWGPSTSVFQPTAELTDETDTR